MFLWLQRMNEIYIIMIEHDVDRRFSFWTDIQASTSRIFLESYLERTVIQMRWTLIWYHNVKIINGWNMKMFVFVSFPFLSLTLTSVSCERNIHCNYNCNGDKSKLAGETSSRTSQMWHEKHDSKLIKHRTRCISLSTHA